MKTFSHSIWFAAAWLLFCGPALADDYSDRPEIYPEQAFAACIEGFARVRIVIDREGKVIEAEIVESEPGEIFDANTLKAAKTWEFPPLGEEVETDTISLVTRVDFFIEDYTRCA